MNNISKVAILAVAVIALWIVLSVLSPVKQEQSKCGHLAVGG